MLLLQSKENKGCKKTLGNDGSIYYLGFDLGFAGVGRCQFITLYTVKYVQYLIYQTQLNKAAFFTERQFEPTCKAKLFYMEAYVFVFFLKNWKIWAHKHLYICVV